MLKNRLLVISLLILSVFTTQAQKNSAKELYKWKAYSSAAEIPKENIAPKDLEGKWESYTGTVYNIYEIDVKGSDPSILEMRENKCRLKTSDEFQAFKLAKNQLQIKDGRKWKSYYINYLSADSLVLSYEYKDYYTCKYYNRILESKKD